AIVRQAPPVAAPAPAPPPPPSAASAAVPLDAPSSSPDASVVEVASSELSAVPVRSASAQGLRPCLCYRPQAAGRVFGRPLCADRQPAVCSCYSDVHGDLCVAPR